MEKKDYWQLFLATGSPDAYLLYTQAKRMENTHVYDDPGPGAAGNGLQ